MLAMVAILFWGYGSGTSDGLSLHILLAQTAIMLTAFGIIGTFNPEGFIKRVWIMLSVVAVLIGSNEIVKLV